MKPKQTIKIAVDVAMTTSLLLLLAYSLAGEATHEWLGVGVFVLFVLHNLTEGLKQVRRKKHTIFPKNNETE